MSYETLLFERAGGVARLTLSRPEVRNALNDTMIREVEAALQAVEADPTTRVLVLRGAGDKAFCAGADLRGVGDRGTPLQARESFSGLARVLDLMARTPIIAHVHGFALAGAAGWRRDVTSWWPPRTRSSGCSRSGSGCCR